VKVTFDTVRKIALQMPRVVEGTSWGSPDLKVDGKMFACIPTHRSAEPGSLVVRMSIDDRDLLIAEDPATYYVKEHYVDYPCVLVRMSRIHPDALRDLLTGAYDFVLRQRKRTTRRRSG